MARKRTVHPRRIARSTPASSITDPLLDLISRIPKSRVSRRGDLDSRVNELIKAAASNSALTSGGASIVPGPLGLVTIIPDLLLVWKIQAQLVADIARVHGRTAQLGPEQMLHCLFRHSAAQAVRDLGVRAASRTLLGPPAVKVVQAAARKVGVAVSRRVLAKSVGRFLPVLGAVAVGGYAYYDTRQVGLSAHELFKAVQTGSNAHSA